MIELDWAEFGMVTVPDGFGRRSVGEIGLLNWSHTLPSLGLALSRFHPADPQLGLGLGGPVDWDLWPPHFRGGLLFRKLVVDGRSLFFVHCVRGEREQPAGLSSRYFSYGRWLVLPTSWFTDCDRKDPSALDELRMRLHTALHELSAPPELVAMQQATEKKRLELRPIVAQPTVATVIKNARLLAAGGRGVRVDEPLAASEPEALSCLILAALLVPDGFDAIAESGIAISPPPNEDESFALVVPRQPTVAVASRELWSRLSSLAEKTDSPIKALDAGANDGSLEILAPPPASSAQEEWVVPSPLQPPSDGITAAAVLPHRSMQAEDVPILGSTDAPDVVGDRLSAMPAPMSALMDAAPPPPSPTAATEPATSPSLQSVPGVPATSSLHPMAAAQPNPPPSPLSLPEMPAPSIPFPTAESWLSPQPVSEVLATSSPLPTVAAQAVPPQLPQSVLVSAPTSGPTEKPASTTVSSASSIAAISDAEPPPQPNALEKKAHAASKLPILLISIAVSLVLVSLLCWIVVIITKERERQAVCEMLFPLRAFISIYSIDTTKLAGNSQKERRIVPGEMTVLVQKSKLGALTSSESNQPVDCDCPSTDRDKAISKLLKAVTSDRDSARKLQQVTIRCSDIWDSVDGTTNPSRGPQGEP